MWLAVNHNTSITSGELFRFSKRIARASELDSCQSFFFVIHEAMKGFKNLKIH